MAVLVGTAGLVLALTIGALAFSQLNLTQLKGSRNDVRNAAEAVLQLALAEVCEHEDYGLNKESLSWTSPDGLTRGTLTFDKDQPDYSSNRLKTDVPTEGSRGVVPANSLQLIGKARRGGLESRVIVLVHVPPYPFAVSSSGEFHSGGSMLVGELPEHENPAFLAVSPPDLTRLKPGNLASRANTAQSIKLKASDVVLGDVAAAGQIEEEPGAQVRGEKREHDDISPLPDLDIDSFSPPPAITQTLNAGSIAARPDSLLLDSFHKSTGALTIPNGLELKSGVLYVDGDLTVNGGIKGKGAIFCKGKVVLSGGAELNADNQVALLAKNGVTMTGTGVGNTNFFQGLVYTEGDVTADKLSVTGAVVANGGKVDLSRSAAISQPSQNFRRGWLAEKTWRWDIGAKQLIDHDVPEMVELAARGVPTPTGELEVKWYLHAHINAYHRSGLVRTDRYSATGQLLGRTDHVNFADEEQLTLQLADVLGFKFDAKEDGAFALALIVLGIAKSAMPLAALADQEPALTPQEVRTAIVRGSIDLDLNTFLGLEDKMRVLLWKEIW